MAKEQSKVPSIDEIDISAVRNIDAVEKIEPSFSKKVTSNIKKGKSKFNFVESELIPLPSRGNIYSNITEDEDILNGFIKMKPMTVNEEKILSTTRFVRGGIATRMILDRCIVSDIDAKDILLFDSNFLLFYLRKISYGDEYRFEIQCNNITCERKFEHSVNISELIFEELPKDFAEPIVIKLPVSKYTVKTTLPRLHHSEDIIKKTQNRKKSTDEEDRRLIENYLSTTQEILDDENEEVTRGDWEDFFEALPGSDIAELRDVTTFSTGVDRLENVICPYCETDYSGTIPIGPEFFRF